MAIEGATAACYDESYKKKNYFRHRKWLYAPYISSLIAFLGLEEGSSVLDVGCGQGFFCDLFGKHGMKVHGIDISGNGIRTAETLYGRPGITFAVSDIRTARFPEQFDCIFVRSCSLYNTDSFSSKRNVTQELLSHLKPGGIFVFAYNSNFSSKISPTWRYHSLEDVRQHFSNYSGVQVFFLNKIITFLLRKYSMTWLVTQFNILLSRLSGMGGEFVCMFRKPERGFPRKKPE